ncbi:DUF2459 domain-containing protein [Petrachloros mirabilis]
MNLYANIMMVVRLGSRNPIMHLQCGRFFRHYLLCLTVVAVLFGCASPAKNLWPPEEAELTHTIYVSLDTLHAMIAFPVSGSQVSGSGAWTYEEWGYAERAWYLEKKTGLTGVVRALFWPTEGVVEVGKHDRLWAHRTPQPPASLFMFSLSQEGYSRLRAHLRGTIASGEPVAATDGSMFYSAVRSYHVFHTCHQYAAEALREAGLPIAPSWALGRSTLAWQLERAEKMGEEMTSP